MDHELAETRRSLHKTRCLCQMILPITQNSMSVRSGRKGRRELEGKREVNEDGEHDMVEILSTEAA